MKKTNIDHYTDKEALDFHKDKKPGKIEIISSKNMTTKRDLALAYSPGVAGQTMVRLLALSPTAAGTGDVITGPEMVLIVQLTPERFAKAASRV